MDDYYEDYDSPCPHCGHSPTRWRDCSTLGCDDGYIDDYEYDPMWYEPGDVSVCSECHGTGVVSWCPQCGKDLQEKVTHET